MATILSGLWVAAVGLVQWVGRAQRDGVRDWHQDDVCDGHVTHELAAFSGGGLGPYQLH